MSEKQEKEIKFEIHPIGYVRRDNGQITLEILEPYRPAMKELDKFSHVQVFWWFNQFDDDEYRVIMQSEHSPYDAPVMGMFACRSPVRPNPIALTTAKMLKVDEEKGVVEIVDIDAFDGTPVLDLKPYFPICDRVREAQVAPWADGWGDWLPDEGMGLEEGEG